MLTPPPHVLLQLLQGPQFPQEESTAGGLTTTGATDPGNNETNDIKQYIDFKQPPNGIRSVIFSSRYLSKNKEFESTAVGGEGAGSVGEDPVHLLSHPFVECVLHLFQAYLIAF